MPERNRAARPGKLPNLFVIGGMKCGSTSLHNYLHAHPEVYMSRRKELNFFYRERAWSQGLDWYRSQFDPDAAVRGESSVNYTKSPRVSRLVARRMMEVAPKPKVIYLVRDPIARSISHYTHTYAKGEETRSLSEALEDHSEQYVSRSLFYENLEPYLEYLPSSSLLVIPQEELLSDRARTLEAVFRFVGVDPSIDRPEFSTLWETGAEKLGSGGGGPKLPDLKLKPAVRERLQEHFAPDVAQLREATGLALERWSV